MTYQLHLGDCLEFMRGLPDGCMDCAVTDPPYPDLKGGLSYAQSFTNVAPARQNTVTIGTEWGNDLEALKELPRVCRYGAIVFCSWHSISKVRDLCGGTAIGLVTWHKPNAQNSLRNRPHYSCEYAWLIEYSPGMNWKALETCYVIANLPAGCFATERITIGKNGPAAHKTQKPLQLMTALLAACPAGGCVIDPYMGTGTTGVSCIKLGLDFIGAEISPDYYAIAQKRIEAAAAQSTFNLTTEAVSA